MSFIRLLATLTMSSVTLTACASENCDIERVAASMPTTVDFEDQSSVVHLEDYLTFTMNTLDFTGVQEFLTATGAHGGAIWTLSAPLPTTSIVEFVAFQLTGPLVPGDVVPVTTVLQAGGWGAARSTTPSFGVGAGEFVASTVSGTFEVLGVGPLRLRVDLLTTDGSRELRLQGEMSARREGDRGCE